MNNKDLMYFCKLIETGNYSLTANTFNVTQPAISMAIKRLEKYFGYPLIIQKNKKSKIRLTPAGKILYKKGIIFLQELSSISYDVKHAADRKIRLSFSGEAGSRFIPDIVKEFADADIVSLLDTRFERSADAFEGLTNGDIDVAIYSWMVPINDPKYYIRNLGRTELVIITGLNDPWNQLEEINASKLRERNFIARNTGYLTRECLDAEGKLGDFTPNIIYTVPTMKLMLDLVERNVGIALAMRSSLIHPEKYHIIHLQKEQRLWAYMQMAMRKSFIPNKYQEKGINILRNFHKKH